MLLPVNGRKSARGSSRSYTYLPECVVKPFLDVCLDRRKLDGEV